MIQRANLGTVVIDPKTSDIRTLIPFCVAGSPTQCLIATVAREELGGMHISVRIEHTPDGKVTGGKIGLTYGDYRFERPMNPSELRFAQAFDQGRIPGRTLYVNFDLTDPMWSAKPKQVGGGRSGGGDGKGTGTPGRKSIRATSLAMWRMQRHALQEGRSA